MAEVEVIEVVEEVVEVVEVEFEEEDDVSNSETTAQSTDWSIRHPASAGSVLLDTLIGLDVTSTHPAAVHVVKDHKRASELKAEGNRAFAARELDNAARLYTMALEKLPESEEHNHARSVFFANRAACYLHQKEYESVIEDCTLSIEQAPDYVKAYIRRAQAYEALDDLETALQDLNQVVSIDPSYGPGLKAQARVDAIVKEKQEKLKEEMMSKLKDLGNTVLGKFGMSLDNFKVNQDPGTGSYSVNFNQ